MMETRMDTIPAADAKTHFGALLDQAQREPVTISKNGRAVAVLMSVTAFEEHQRIKLELLRREVRKGLDDARRRRVMPVERAFAQLDEDLAD
jgi:prevent-host-death family protein